MFICVFCILRLYVYSDILITKDTVQKIEEAGKWDELENSFSELYPDGINEIMLNNLLWFESDWIFESLGIEDEEESKDD